MASPLSAKLSQAQGAGEDEGEGMGERVCLATK